jgi:hypothetical protein
MPGFSQFFRISSHDQRQVRIRRSGHAEGPLQRNLPTCAGQQIGPAHHVGHVLHVVIDHYGELVGEDSVLAAYDEVAQLALPEPALSLYSIVKEHHETVSEAEPRRGWEVAACWSVAAGSGVTGVFVAAQLAPRAAALEGGAGGFELLQGRAVERQSMALVDNFAVPGQAEAFEGAQDAIRAPGDDARGIQILNADQPATAVMARIDIASYRGQERAEVEVPRRRRGETPYVLPIAQR